MEKKPDEVNNLYKTGKENIPENDIKIQTIESQSAPLPIGDSLNKKNPNEILYFSVNQESK